MEAKDTIMNEKQMAEVAKESWQTPLTYPELVAVRQAEISFLAGRDEEAKELRKVVDFAYGVAKTMDDLKSSHVFFILQQAFGENMEWDDVQEILTRIIEISGAKLQEWGIKED